MRTAIILVLLAMTSLAQTSKVVTVKAWTRTHIMGIPGGGVLDPTDTIADGQRSLAVAASVEQSGVIIAAANTGLTNALSRLYDVADNTNNFTGRLYIAADIGEDPDYANVQAFVLKEETTTSNTVFYTHYTRLLEDAPKTMWQFNPTEGVSYWAAGNIDTNAALTSVDGYDCYKITVHKPEQVGNIILRTHKFLKWGTTDAPLAIPDAGLELVCNGSTNTPYTGPVVITNGANEITENYLSGFLGTTTTNIIEEL